MRNWVCVVLSSAGEQIEFYEVLKREITELLGRPLLEIFYPASWDGVDFSEKTSLFDGYVFVEFREGVPYERLVGSDYILDVLTGQDGEFSLIDDGSVDQFKHQLRDETSFEVHPGQHVNISTGEFKSCKMSVVEVRPTGVTGEISIFSKRRRVDLARNQIEPLEEVT